MPPLPSSPCHIGQHPHAPRSKPLIYLTLARGVPPVSESSIPLAVNLLSVRVAPSVPRSRPLRKSPEPFGPAATLVGPKAFGLPAMSLGASRCSRRTLFARRMVVSRGESGGVGRARGAGPGPGGTWFASVPKTFGKRSAGGGGRPDASGVARRGKQS